MVKNKKNGKFTEKEIRALKPKENQIKAYDVREGTGEGFAITVFPSGKKSFIYLYHYCGRKRRMTLGQYPQCSLERAHAMHREAISLLATGKDPAYEKRKALNEISTSPRVEDLINEYIEKWAKPNKRSWKADERCLNKDIRPFIGKRNAKDITRRDIILILDKIHDRGAPIAANRTLACVRRMFNFAVERDILQASPCTAIKASKENRCDRVLSHDEIRTIWRSLDTGLRSINSTSIYMSHETRLILKLQLVTAQRKGEIISAEWDEINFETRWWTIPANKAKNNQTHRVFLSNLAVELLSEVKKISSCSRFLFPSKSNDLHITGAAIDHAVRRSNFLGLQHWSPHSLRRTAATHMTSMGISRLVVSKILNHSDNASVTSIYDRHSYDQEKQNALEAWSTMLTEIVSCESIHNMPLSDVEI